MSDEDERTFDLDAALECIAGVIIWLENLNPNAKLLSAADGKTIVVPNVRLAAHAMRLVLLPPEGTA